MKVELASLTADDQADPDKLMLICERKHVLLTLLEFENGVHGFDQKQKSDPRASEIIQQTLEFIKQNFGGAPREENRINPGAEAPSPVNGR